MAETVKSETDDQTVGMHANERVLLGLVKVRGILLLRR